MYIQILLKMYKIRVYIKKLSEKLRNCNKEVKPRKKLGIIS